MKLVIQSVLTGLVFVIVAGAAVYWLANPNLGTTSRPGHKSARGKSTSTSTSTSTSVSTPEATASRTPAPTSTSQPAPLFVNPRDFEDGGYSVAAGFTGEVRDPSSLSDLREAIQSRVPRGLAELKAKYAALKTRAGASPSRAHVLEQGQLEKSIGLLYLYEGKLAEATTWTSKALETSQSKEVDATTRANLTALLGIIALRRGEVENCLGCVGPSSCIFPIVREATHRNPSGSREAIRWFTRYLEATPGDLRVIWLLNLAYMTLGEYPDGVPLKYVLPLEGFTSRTDVGRFLNVAPRVGLTSRGPNLAGGSIFDDFNGDGLADLFSTSLDAGKGASLFINRGDGTFSDRSDAAGLAEQVYALNVTRTDFDNDGDLDVLLLRGGWEMPMRPSLLRNKGDGTFDDVTLAAGLGEPISCESAAWGDYDGDGWLDVYLCGEYFAPGPAPNPKPVPRNRGRLFHNRGDGTFENVAEAAGVLNERCGKGAVWGDYDDDGKPDLFVSNLGQECRLYHNEGNGRFKDVARELGVTGPEAAFACWFWDYDNDGRLDLYVNEYRASVAEVVGGVVGVKLPGGSRPRLYRNLGKTGFRDVTDEVGLGRAMAPMGSNFGDIDNDGFPDFYLGTGSMSYSGLDPDLLIKNVDGQRFEDVTLTSGTGHLQKGHGVSFADWDNDGDLDLFVEFGGATPGDQAYNVLFQNPTQGRHWLKVKLVGTKTNRAAIGARIGVTLKHDNGETHSLYRTVGNNSSFGGNSLVELFGLLGATRVADLTVSWPTSHTTQTFHDLDADRAIEITEGSNTVKVLDLPRLTPPDH